MTTAFVSGAGLKRRTRWRWRWLLGGLVLLGGAAVMLGGRSSAQQIDPSALVRVERGVLKLDVLETGRIQPSERVELKSKVAGQVAAVHVEEGQQVHKDQVLVLLDPTDYERDVARAQAEIAAAQAAIAYARLRLARTQQGVAQRVQPQAELDTAQYELQAALARLRSAEVALSAAQDRVRYTTIRSPIDGTVIQKGIEVGEVVTPGVQATFEGKPLLTVADLSTLLVRVELNQIDVAKVPLGAKVTVHVDALPGRAYEARVTRIAAASTRPASGSVEVFTIEATLSPADPAIKPGMTADVRIALDQKADVLLLPLEAVREKDGRATVTVVRAEGTPEQTSESVEVKLGAASDRQQEIIAGVAEGDRVWVNPPSAEGSKLQAK
jgi:HlyD family secretion protein/macrolide-specific efflux system membrane fusion protein